MPGLSVVIPNYNGTELLPKYLPSVLDAAEVAGAKEVLFVDDASRDNSLETAANVSGSIKIIARKENGGFGEAVNTGAALAGSDLMAVLMTDIQMEPDALSRALEVFSDEGVFAAGLDLKTEADKGNSGVTCLPFRRGLYHTCFPDVETPGAWNKEPCHIAFAMGGAMVVRKSIFDQLGGFSNIYAPYFWEDVDIAWRAWKMGYRSVSVPGAVAWHRHPHKTIESNEKRHRIDQVVFRNRIRFIASNITDRRILQMHTIWKLLMLLKRRNCPSDPFVAACREVYAVKIHKISNENAKVSDSILTRYLDKPRNMGQLPWVWGGDG